MTRKKTKEELLSRVKEILVENNPNMTSNEYDYLTKIKNKPTRSLLRERTGMSWGQMKKKLVGTPDNLRMQSARSWIGNGIDEEVEVDYTEKECLVTTRSLDIRSEDDAIKAAKVDLTKWRATRKKIKSWEVTISGKRSSTGEDTTYTMFGVTVWLEPLTKPNIQKAIELLIKDIPKFKPTIPKLKIKKDNNYALEIAPYDTHFGKLAWGKETMQGNYNLKIASEVFLDSIEKNINYSAPFRVSQIFYILGQDLMHAENFEATTPKGHNTLDVDSRLPKIYKTAKEATIKALYMCREVAPVKVLWVPGNHDMHASFYLSEVIKEHFRNDKLVEVDNSPPWRKLIVWGNLIIGLAHDASRRQVKLINILPQFWPKEWGKSKFRELHTAHKHTKMEVKYYPVLTVGGTIIRQIPTMSTIDAWHYTEGFVDAVPAGESFLLTKDCGICAHYTAYIDYKGK